MDSRERGFIVIHRKIRSWVLWKFMSAEQRMVWIQILLDANWKDSEAWVGTTRITVKRGQLLHSERTIAQEAGVSRKVVRTTIEKLAAEGAIVRSNIGQVQISGGHEKGPAAGPAVHVITVVNYGKYQDVSDEAGPGSGPRKAQGGPSKGPAGAPSEPVEPEEPTTLSDAGASDPEVKAVAAWLLTPPAVAVPSPATAAAETPAPKPKASAAAKPTDPRFPVLKAVWLEEYQRRYGAPYDSWGVADAQGLHKRLAVPPEVFRDKARRGLAVVGYGHTATCAELCSSKLWARLAGTGPPGKLQRTMAPVGDWGNPEEAQKTLRDVGGK